MALIVASNHTSATAADLWYWKHWANATTSSTTSGTYVNDPWGRWTTANTSTTHLAYNPTYTWDQWAEMPDEQEYQYHQYPRHEPTQAELDAIQRRREDQSARLLAEQQRLQVAQPRALELFRALLTADQITQMDTDGEVWVKGSAGGFYVIEVGGGRVHGNIRRIDEHGCMLGRLCVQPSMYDHIEGAALPTADGHVGQLLAIRFNEPALLEKANWSSQRPCQQPDVPILRAA